MARTILVADDSPTVQKKASGILTGEGLEVVTVSNGVAAVKKLPTVKPLVVLADVSMPGKDGYEVCEFIKSTLELRSTPVILIFSDTDPYEGTRGARVQADGTIKKPFDRDELIAIVNKFVAQSEAAAPKPAKPPMPPAAFVVEPMDEDPEASMKAEGPDLSSLSQGVVFGMPGAEEPSAPAFGPGEFSASPVLESEATPEPALESLIPPPESATSASEVLDTSAVEPPVYEEQPVSAEPVLIEEPTAPSPVPEPPAERTMMFHTPADIAEPVLSDEAVTEAAAPAAEPPAAAEPSAAPEPPPAAEPELEEAEPEPAHASPTTLESYTLNEAAAGHVRFETSEPAAVAAPEPEPVAPPPAPATTLDTEQIFSIVHKVVLKMSPPALSPQMIEDMARKFADEIIAELTFQS